MKNCLNLSKKRRYKIQIKIFISLISIVRLRGLMFNISFDKEAQKEFLKLDSLAQKLINDKIRHLKNANFSKDKLLKGKYKGKFRKRVGNYRIIYLKENDLLIIVIIRIAH